MKAHDVRRLFECVECGQLGSDTAEVATRLGLPVVVLTGQGYRHAEHLMVIEMLELDPEQQGQIRLSDIGVEKMQRLLQAAR